MKNTIAGGALAALLVTGAVMMASMDDAQGAFTFLANHDPATHGVFRPVNPQLDTPCPDAGAPGGFCGGTRIRATGPDGTYDAYRLADGRILGEALVVPSAAKVTADTAANTAAAQFAARVATARTVVQNQVTRVKGIAAGSRTDQDRWLLALSFLLLKEE